MTTKPNKASGSKDPFEKPKGWAKVGVLRKLVNAIIKRSRLEITSLHIHHPDANGLCAKGKIRLTHLGTGPFPLVGLQVKFKDPKGATLHWSENEAEVPSRSTWRVQSRQASTPSTDPAYWRDGGLGWPCRSSSAGNEQHGCEGQTSKACKQTANAVERIQPEECQTSSPRLQSSRWWGAEKS